jgi:PAS domain S-box-containing protein
MTDLLLEMSRHGFLEETYFTFSYSPVRDEAGEVGGVLITCTETTERVIGERRLRLLRELGSRGGALADEDEACRLLADDLSRAAADVPFALIYRLEDGGRSARLAGTAGTEAGSAWAPARVELADPSAPWPLARVVRERAAVTVEGLPPDVTIRSRAPRTAVLLPIRATGGDQVVGVLVAGVSAQLSLDEGYRGFLDLVAGHVSSGLAASRAFAEERARARALAELDRAKTDFFSNVSHELRTPVTLQLGPLEDALADRTDPLPPAQRERVELAHRSGLRLLRLVNTLLDFTRVEAGRTEVRFEPTDLARLTCDVASQFEAAVRRVGLELVLDCPPLPRAVSVDRDMWEKVVLNLLSNALKFTFTGRIEVGLRPEGDGVELRVADTGVGVAPEERGRLFQRFHRIRGQQSRTHEGTGIGLALVQEIARLHGGSVHVDSEVGVGTTFRVRVPWGEEGRHAPAELDPRARAAYVGEAERWEAAPAPDPRPGDPERVLVVDDNADMREYLSRLLSPRFPVEAVGDGAAALDAARRSPPLLVVADVMMPRMDGHALVRALREDPRTRTVPVMLLTARAGEPARVAGLAAGADDYVEKPFATRELLARVESHVARARARRDAAEHERAERLAAELEGDVLRGVFEHAPAMMALLRGPKHVFEMVNRPYLRSIGARSADEVLGRTVPEVLPEVVGQGFLDRLDQVYETGEPYGAAEQPIRLDAGLRYFTFVYRPLRDATGAVDRILVHAVDVTETVAARARIEEKERLLSLVTDALPALVAYIGTDMTYRFANATYREWFGVDPASLVGQHPERVVGREAYHAVRPALLRALAGEKVSTEATLPTDPPRRIYSTYVPDRDADGRVRGIVALATDVTLERAREETLRVSEERFRLVTAATREAVWDWDLDTDHLQWGEGLRELFGHAPDEVGTTGAWWAEHVHPEDRARVRETIDTAIRRADANWAAEYRFRRHDGTYAIVTDRGYVDRGPDRRARRMVGTMADVTDVRHAQERLAHAQHMELAGTLAGGVAHEINNMMTIVIGLSELTLRRLTPSDRAFPDLTEIVKAARRAAGITHQLLAYSGRQVLQPKRFDLVDAIASLEPLVSGLVGAGIHVRRAPGPIRLWVEVDRGHLDQAIVNLVLNARDAMPDGGQLTFSVRRVSVDAGDPVGLPPGAYARLDVSDTGVGMDAATLRRVFEPFFTTKPLGSGTGLGLAAVYGLVRQSGGTVRLESTPGAGTRVSLYLPERGAPAVSPPVVAPAEVRPSERVLVVEDEALVRHVACLVLEDAGFRVLQARNGREALALLDAGEQVDVVLSDVVMPEMGGRDLGRALAVRGFRGPVLYMSGYTGEHLTQHEMLDAGATVLQKPFTADSLVREVRAALETARVPLV